MLNKFWKSGNWKPTLSLVYIESLAPGLLSSSHLEWKFAAVLGNIPPFQKLRPRFPDPSRGSFLCPGGWEAEAGPPGPRPLSGGGRAWAGQGAGHGQRSHSRQWHSSSSSRKIGAHPDTDWGHTALGRTALWPQNWPSGCWGIWKPGRNNN